MKVYNDHMLDLSSHYNCIIYYFAAQKLNRVNFSKKKLYILFVPTDARSDNVSMLAPLSRKTSDPSMSVVLCRKGY